MKKYWLILLAWSLIKIPGFANNLMLGYHMVDYSFNHFYSVLPDVLEWQIRYLKSQNVPIISMNDFASYYEGKTNFNTSAEISFDDGWKSQLNALPILKNEAVKGLFFIFPEAIDNNKLYFTSTDLLTLKNSGWAEFGGHSYDHRELIRLNPEELQKEIVTSKTILEDKLGQKINYFAYPYGLFDPATKSWVRSNYQYSIGVRDSFNTLSSDRFNLNRFLIFKTTTFGEFIHIVDRLTGKPNLYNVTNLGKGSSVKYFSHVHVKIFEYPGKPDQKSVLIVPNSSIGSGWLHKTISALTTSGINIYVMVGRNNSLPYDRPEEIHSITNWGISEMLQDMDKVLDYLKSRNKKVSVITWGDGFDILMAGLSVKDYSSTIKSVIALNPSIRTLKSDTKEFTSNIQSYETMLLNGKYSPENLAYFEKVKVLSDMMYLKPDSISPFSSLPYTNLSNKDALEHFIMDAGDPDLSIDYRENGYTMDDYRDSLIQPLPVFSPLVSLTYLRDLNRLWEKSFVWNELGITNKNLLKFSVFFHASKVHQNSIIRITNTFPNLVLKEVDDRGTMSTIEQMLDSKTTGNILEHLKSMN